MDFTYWNVADNWGGNDRTKTVLVSGKVEHIKTAKMRLADGMTLGGQKAALENSGTFAVSPRLATHLVSY